MTLSKQTEFLEHTQELLRDAQNPGRLFAVVDQMALLLGQVTGISTDDDMANWSGHDLEVGRAISPVKAARCLKEPIRTKVFLKGMQQAIAEKLKGRDAIHILYAGTGPYGSILLPLLPLINSPSVRVTLLDIHPENVDAVSKVIDWLGVENNVAHVFCADATLWQPVSQSPSGAFDLIISETMNTFLKREPQVSIFAHLQQFLKPDGDLIPQKIFTEAWLPEQKFFNANSQTLKKQNATKLSDLLVLDKKSAKHIHQQNLTSLSYGFEMPGNRRYFPRIELNTRLQVFQQHRLKRGDCSLTIPLAHDHQAIPAESIVKATYEIHKDPQWKFACGDYFDGKNMPADPYDDGDSLAVFWGKYRRLYRHPAAITTSPQEWKKEQALLKNMQIDFGEAIAFLNQYHPTLAEFAGWLSSRQPRRDTIRKDALHE